MGRKTGGVFLDLDMPLEGGSLEIGGLMLELQNAYRPRSISVPHPRGGGDEW